MKSKLYLKLASVFPNFLKIANQSCRLIGERKMNGIGALLRAPCELFHVLFLHILHVNKIVGKAAFKISVKKEFALLPNLESLTTGANQR
jgi:hypothetical protein